MSASLFLGIDIGTSVAKGTIIDGTGKILAQKLSFLRYTSSSSSGFEHDPEIVWWTEFVQIAEALLNEIGDDRSNVECISITGMIPNVAPLNTNGTPIYNGVLFYDSRAYEIEQRLDKELGTPKWQNEVLSKLIWLRDELGEKWKNTKKILTTHSYIVFKLTGTYSIDTVTAIESGNVYLPKEKRWNSDILQQYKLSASIFPEVYAPSEIVGYLTDEASTILGLKSGIPIVAGTGDTISTILGAGLRKKNEMLIYYGTYNCSALLKQDINQVLAGNSLENPIDWTATIPRSGQQISSFAKQICPADTQQESLLRFDALAEKSVPGANGVLFVQTLNLPTSTVSSEPMAGIINLSINNTLSDICRALLEAFGYGLRYSYEVLGTNPEPTNCYAAGGGAKSTIWKQIISDITGLQQIYYPAADRGLGSAILAGIAVKPNFLDQIRNQISDNAIVIRPNTDHQEIYNRRYNEYCEFIAKHNA